MEREMPLEEDQSASCRTIAHFLGKHTGASLEDGAVREVILKDLCWRLSRLDTMDRALVMAESWYDLLPEETKRLFSRDALRVSELGTPLVRKKQQRDAGIVTVIGPELRAVLRALGGDGKAPPDLIRDGCQYWLRSIDRPGASSRSVVITMVGEQRNVPCAMAVQQLLNDFDVRLLILIGIAAGPRTRVKLGDIVYAERVYDYEHVRLELRKLFGIPVMLRRSLPRPLYLEVPKQVKSQLKLLDADLVRSFFSTLVAEIPEKELGIDPAGLAPDLLDGTVAAGEKLFADGSLERMCKHADQRIRAADQEDSGFAQACELKPLPWCIFRGICDHGDPRKGDDWHLVAALAAAAGGVTFLRHCWEPATPEEREG